MSPDDTDVIDNVFADVLTLTTCNPRFSASTRLVVQAKLAHSQLFPNSGLPAATPHADPKSEHLAGDSNVELADALFWGLRRPSPLGGARLLRGLPLPAPALDHLGRGRRRRASSCSGSSSAPSARCCRPASDRVLVEQPLPDHFRGFAAVAERDGGTTYAAICRGVADDDGRALAPRRGAPPPAPAAASCWPPCTTCSSPAPSTRWPRYYDTVRRRARHPTDRHAASGQTPPPRSPTSAGRTAPRSRSWSPPARTQTNEVGRCTAPAPRPLPHRRRAIGREVPLSLLDLGTSAGLNLLFDDYAYTYRADARRRRPDRRQCGGRLSRSSARPATTSPTFPSCACRPWPSGSASTSRPSTRAPTTPPAGCWPASGRTTRPASAACVRRWPTCGPRRTRLGSSGATW